MRCTVWGMQLITMLHICMMTDDNQTYHGDHFEMYRNTEALCCIKELTQFCRSDTLKTNKHKKGNEICHYERWGEGKLDKGSQKV